MINLVCFPLPRKHYTKSKLHSRETNACGWTSATECKETDKDEELVLKGPILYCFSSVSHSCQRSNNSVFNMHCPKPICGPEFQLSKSRSSELYWEQAVSVPAPLNANELHLPMPALPATRPSQEEDAACASGSMR